jgi:hypothetical protein
LTINRNTCQQPVKPVITGNNKRNRRVYENSKNTNEIIAEKKKRKG